MNFDELIPTLELALVRSALYSSRRLLELNRIALLPPAERPVFLVKMIAGSASAELPFARELAVQRASAARRSGAPAVSAEASLEDAPITWVLRAFDVLPATKEEILVRRNRG